MSKKKVKIGFFGDGQWGLNTLNLILKKKNYQIKFVCVRYKSVNKNLILNFCKKNRIKYFRFKNINSKLAIKEIKSYKLDTLVSMSYDQIFKKETINNYKSKIINCHAGCLPFYRGRSPLNWVLINDESFFGITVHYINQGIDKGDIILQRKFDIKDKDNYKSILNKAYKECPKILFKAIHLVVNKKDKPVKQNFLHKKGSYYRKRLSGDERINWKTNAREVFCFIRALSKPSVIASTYFKNKKILINESDPNFIKSKKNASPGEIIKVSNNYFLIQTNDFIIKVKKWHGDISKGMILN
jgi:methionyl-tRNA formyltransferase